MNRISKTVPAFMFGLVTALFLAGVPTGSSLSNFRATSLSTSNEPARTTVSICTSAFCKQRGSPAALAAFVGLVPGTPIQIQSCGCLGACEKGPNARIAIGPGNNDEFEIHGLSGVDKVTSVITDLIGARVSDEGLACIRANLEANELLAQSRVTLAIEAYDRALATGYRPLEGVVRSMRADAFLSRACSHRRALERFNEALNEDDAISPGHTTNGAQKTLVRLLSLLSCEVNSGAHAVYVEALERAASDLQEAVYHANMYTYSLQKSLEDSLRCTEIQPWLQCNPARAGKIFQELKRFDAASECFSAAARAARSPDERKEFERMALQAHCL